MTEGRKIQIVLDPSIAMPGTTLANTVRDAIRFYDWCRKAMSEGWTICAIRGETRREPMLRFEETHT